MTKILGIDTGTNSLGWAIVEKKAEQYCLLDKGVNIFQEGVNTDKDNESSKAAERTGYRAIRVRYYRIKLRKIRLLHILTQHHLCPPLTSWELRQWRLKSIYPTDELFMQWQRTDEEKGQNPYAYRHLCLHEKLDLTQVANRYILGRVFYHFAQRRGFLSNRKDQSGEDVGVVNDGISALSEEMRDANTLAIISTSFMRKAKRYANTTPHATNTTSKSFMPSAKSSNWTPRSCRSWRRPFLPSGL